MAPTLQGLHISPAAHIVLLVASYPLAFMVLFIQKVEEDGGSNRYQNALAPANYTPWASFYNKVLLEHIHTNHEFSMVTFRL